MTQNPRRIDSSITSKALLYMASLLDPGCKSPRKRMREMSTVITRGKFDAMRVVKVLLDELAAEDLAPPVRAMWRKQTKRLARETARRYRASR